MSFFVQEKIFSKYISEWSILIQPVHLTHLALLTKIRAVDPKRLVSPTKLAEIPGQALRLVQLTQRQRYLDAAI
jgi:hypothetical protein